MKSNFIVIIFSGVSISIMGAVILLLPASFRLFIDRNIESFLAIPPISVASYIFVFKYHEKFKEFMPPMSELLGKILQGGFAAFVCFILMSLITSLLYRLYI